jgi:hypothetical protein
LSSGIQGQRQIPTVPDTGESNLSGVCFLTNACNPLAGSLLAEISLPSFALAWTLLIVSRRFDAWDCDACRFDLA